MKRQNSGVEVIRFLDGWSIRYRSTSEMAYLRVVDGWTEEQAEVVADAYEAGVVRATYGL